MSEKFRAAMAFVRYWEGGWSNHKADPGGLTKWGITIKTLVALALDFNRDGRVNEKDLADMTREQAEEVYRREYFDKLRCEDIPAPLALVVFDCAVNQGPARAAKWLQEVAGLTGKDVDGKIGPVSVARAGKAYDADPREFLREYQVKRALHYSSLSNFVTFGRGWFRRLIDGTIQVSLALIGPRPAAVLTVPQSNAGLAEYMADVAATAEAAAAMARKVAADAHDFALAADGVCADLRDKALDLEDGAE